jgi:hydrogenase nickel incorporation protein HypA/HybF
MHEVSIMQSAVSTAVQQARASGGSKVHQLRLRVGALSGVVPEALEFAFEAVTQGTLAEGARLEVEHVPATCWCAECQTEFPSEDLLYECPRCHRSSHELRRGLELEIISIEIS